MQPARRLCRAGGRPSFTLLSSAVCALLMACLYFASLAQSETDSRRLSSEQNNPLKCANCKLMERLNEHGQTTPWPNRRKWKIEIGVKNTIVHATTSRPREWSARGDNRLGGCEGALCTCWLSTSDANSTILTRGMWLKAALADLAHCCWCASTWRRSKTCLLLLAQHSLRTIWVSAASVWVERHPWSKGGSDRRAHRSARHPPRAPRSLAWPPSAPIQNKYACCRRRTLETPAPRLFLF